MWKKIKSKLVIINKNAKLLGLLPKTDKDFLKEYGEHLTLRDFSRIRMQSKLGKKWADYIVVTIITIEKQEKWLKEQVKKIGIPEADIIRRVLDKIIEESK